MIKCFEKGLANSSNVISVFPVDAISSRDLARKNL